MIFGERLARRRGFLEIEHRTDQALRRYRRSGVSQRLLAHHGGERCARGIAANHELCRIDAERGRLFGNPSGRRDRVLDRGRESVLGGKPVIHRDEAAARGLRQRRGDAIMGLDTAADHAAAMEKNKTRQIFGYVTFGRIEPVRNIACGARHCAVNPGYINHVGACEPHQFRKRLAAFIEGRRRSTVRCGRRHHVEKTLRRGIEGHIGSG